MEYTYEDMNLLLNNDKQVYIAVIDIPINSIIANNETRTLALVYGLNTHIYQSDGTLLTGLEKNKEVMKAMQSLFISIPQVLDTMDICHNTDYYRSSNYRVYLKTKNGVFFKELDGDSREEAFTKALVNNVLAAIAQSIKKK